jgi:uncharacterized protein YbjT (DUF2867 family)
VTSDPVRWLWAAAAVALWLLANGHDVIAMTRDLAHPMAMRLMRRGARLAWADPDDRAAIEESMQGCDALFLATAPDADPETEIRHGTTMVDIASATGLRHVVYSSVPAAAEPTGVPHFDSRHAIEKRLQQQEVPHTVVAPTWLMENFTSERHVEHFREGRLVLPYPPGRKLQQVAVDDVARFVALAFERPTEFLGRRFPVAGDELTGLEMAATFARLLGRPLSYEEQPLASIWAADPQTAGTFEYLARAEPAVDVGALRDTYDIDWHTLDGWARRQSWESLLGLERPDRRGTGRNTPTSRSS